MKLREKLLISMVGIAFFASFVSNFPVTKLAENKFKESAIEKQQIVLESIKNELQNLFNDSVMFLRHYSNNVVFTDSENNIIRGLSYTLNSLDNKGYKDLFVVLKDWRIYNQYGTVKNNFSDEVNNIVAEILKGKKELEIFYPNIENDRNRLLVICSMKDFKQDVIGALVGVFDTNSFAKVIKEKKFGKTGYMVLSYKNFIIAHPDDNMVGFDLLSNDKTKKVGEAVLSKDKGWVEYEFNGKKIVFFEKFEGYDLVIGTIMSLDEALSGINQIRYIGMTLGISTTIIGILIALFISKNISKRIKQVVEMVEEISKGNFEAIPESKHNDEIDLINESLKTMAKNISETIIEILLKSNDATATTNLIDEIAQTISSDELDKNIEDFSAYLEETNAEVETIVNRINDFTELLEGIGSQSSRLAELNKEIAELSDKIADISDTIAVLAINSRIETSRENIDREGLNKISEMIMELSNEVRETARQSKEFLISNEEIITSTVLTSEKISKELGGVRESLQTIQNIVQKNVDSVSKLVEASENNRSSLTKVVESLRTTEEILKELKETVEKFLTSLRISK